MYTENNKTAVHMAAIAGNHDKLKTILEIYQYKTKVECDDKYIEFKKHCDQFLIEDENLVDVNGKTPLDYALAHGH